MTEQSTERAGRAGASTAEFCARAAGGVAAVAGLLVLAGWAFDVPTLTRVLPGAPTMKVNTALAFFFIGVATWQEASPRLPSRLPADRARWLATVCHVLVTSIAGLTLTEYVTGLNFGLDQFFITDSEVPLTSHPGRMAPNTAVGFLLLAGTQLVLAHRPRTRMWLAAAGLFSGLATYLGLFTVVGYASGLPIGYAWGPFTGMAIHSGVLFAMLGAASLGLVATRSGWRWAISTPLAGAFALGLVLLVALSWLSFRSARESIDHAARVRHTHEVRVKIRDIRSLTAELSVAARGYILTGREDLRQSFERSTELVPTAERHVLQLTADNPRQQERIKRLHPLLLAQAQFAAQLVGIRRVNGMDAAIELFSAGRGVQLLGDIQRLLDEMDAEELRLLQIREAESDASISRMFLMLPVGTFLALALFLTVLLLLNAEVVERSHAAEALHDSERRFRELTESLPQLVWTCLPDGRCDYLSPQWVRYTGIPGERQLGYGWAQQVHPDDREPTNQKWQESVRSGANLDVEFRIRRHDGEYRWFRTRAVPMRDGSGDIIRWFGTNTDEEDQKRVEEALSESKERLSLALASSGVGTWSWSVVDNAATWDDFIHPLFGLKPKTFSGRYEDFLALIHPDDRARISQEVADSVEHDALYDTEYRVVWPDGTEHWLASRGRVYRDAAGRPLRMTGVCWDVTGRKESEAEIRRLNADLERQVEKRTAELRAANKELEAFSYSVSHDLRAPLRGVDSFSRMVLEDYGPTLDEEGRRLLNVVRSETRRMGELIDDLLDFSRLGRQELLATECRMTELAESVFMGLAADTRQHVRQFVLTPLPVAHGDRSMLQRVLTNLLANAVKFTRHSPAAVIEIGGSCGDGFNTYYVKDNGVGFDQRYVHKLFGVFQRLHTEEQFEGTGVGLALVQRIIHRHGGKVWAEGIVNQGATFYFSLPTREAA